MEADFWLETWVQGRLGFHQNDFNVLLLRYWPEVEVGGGTVFVPLCGKTRDMLWLESQGYGVVGVELSPIAVQAFFEENRIEVDHRPDGAFELWEGGGIQVLNGDFFELTDGNLAGVTAVYDRASLVALPPHMRQGYAQKMAELLPAGTKVLLICFEYPQEQMSGPPFSVTHEEVLALYAEAFSWQRVRSKDVVNKVRFPVTSFVQNVYILERK